MINSTKNQNTIQGIIAGDEEILKSFYKKNLPYVQRFILQHQGSDQDVEDIFQDALVIVYQKLQHDSTHINTTVSAFFYGVCKNLWRTQLHKRSKYVSDTSLLTNTIIEEDTVIETITRQEQESVYHKHFCRLNTTSKKILQLFFEGKSMWDIAGAMGYSEGYARKKKCKTKESLLAMIRQDCAYQELVCEG